jgi:D-alanyl-D-alanine carboxypeptidase
MYRVSVGASLKGRCIISGLIALAMLATGAAPADAKKRSSYNPPYADIVVDANTGDVLRSSNADSVRFPASLTKIMTLYLLFERIEAGRFTLESELAVSAHAAAQAPSKLGLKPGQTISVEDAIKALVTKSANDVAAVIGEAIAGSEEEFGKLMTRKARALGMTRTVYKNASGLPDEDQVTTARDQALLAMAIQDRFPKYYDYFSTSSFTWRGRKMRNHNRLLGRVKGVDGIKTGYTRASGFNLVTAVHRGDRNIVAVVLGGKSGRWRDARMRDLIEDNIMEASVKRTLPKYAERRPASLTVASVRGPVPLPQVKPDITAVNTATTAAANTVATAAVAQPAPGSTELIKPHIVKTLTVKAGSMRIATAGPLSLLSPQSVTRQSTLGGKRTDENPPAPAGARPGVLGVLPVSPPSRAMPAQVTAFASTATDHIPSDTSAAAQPEQEAKQEAKQQPEPESKPRTGWIIQVGAFEELGEAKARLASAQETAEKYLADGDPYTEPVTKGDKTLFRARFAGLKPSQAKAACRYLKRNDIVCLAIRN